MRMPFGMRDLFDAEGGPSPIELVCRNAIHAGIVELAPEQRRRIVLGSLLADKVRVDVSIDGERVGEATLAELPGGPQGTVRWLAQQRSRESLDRRR